MRKWDKYFAQLIVVVLSNSKAIQILTWGGLAMEKYDDLSACHKSWLVVENVLRKIMTSN